MSDGLGFFFWMDRLTDVLFIVDLILNFFTGWVTKDGAVILERRVIVQARGVPLDLLALVVSGLMLYIYIYMQKYLRSWFLVDLISSIPFDLIYVMAHASGSTQWYARA